MGILTNTAALPGSNTRTNDLQSDSTSTIPTVIREQLMGQWADMVEVATFSFSKQI